MAFEELKRRQSVVWGAAPFENVAAQVSSVHDHLVRELAPQAGERWLDVATGTGAIAVRAARAGADVTASDLAPALIETAKRLAAEDGLEIHFEVADVERLPYDDGSFDVVSSSFGAMFAPNHGAVAHELARVCRAGGRIGLSTWDPEGGIGEFFRMMRPFQPDPPPGTGDPLDWGDEEYVRGLLGRDFELRFARGQDPQRGDSPEQVWQLFLTSFGPIKALHESLDAERREELHQAYLDFYGRHTREGRVESPREYLLILGTRR